MNGTRKTLAPPHDRAAQTTAPHNSTRDGSYAASLALLFATFTAPVTDKARAFLLSRLSVAAAKALGLRATPTDIADEFLRCLAVYAPLIQQKRLRGYGPMRARFALELTRSAAASLDRHRTADPSLRGAAAERERTLAKTDAMRAEVVTALRNLAGDDPEAIERVRTAGKPKRAVDARLRGMTQLAQEITRAREEIPAALLDDAGLDADTLDAVLAITRDTADAHASSRARRLAQQRLRAELAEPCGRIFNELKTMLRAARAARFQDPTIPDVTSWLVTRTVAAKPAAPSPA
ncbi:MAG: hypothetical protein U0326_06920 [Polyangiales bacterium]